MLSLFFLLIPSVSAGKVLVENVFSDISSNYEYRDELQELYDRGMIIPDASGRFSPDAYLNRDEFVGISMEVICERCIQPHTQYKFIEEYQDEDVYFDIDNTNPYFYCVAEADKKNYVRGYDIGESCQDGSNKFDERPFCPLNRINLEEAVAVLLRNSGIFTINDNAVVVSQIRNGVITQNIAGDVTPTDELGNPYTFYGYLRKALDYSIDEYDERGVKKTYRLLEKDTSGNLNPKESVTKEEFLKMSYIALKSNSCSDVVDNDLAIAIDIWEKSCNPGDEDCEISQLDDPNDTYDFTPDVEGYCELGIDDPNGYKWRFYNTDNGDEFFHYGTYLDDITLPSIGEWKVYLTVRDKCGNTGEVYSTIMVEKTITVIIDPWDESCIDGEECEEDKKIIPEEVCEGAECIEVLPPGECDLGEECDYIPEVITSCELGIDESSYVWEFENETTGEKLNFTGDYIDNFEFPSAGRWKVSVEVTDNCGQSASTEIYVIVTDITVIIEPWDEVCIDGEECDEENKKDDPIIVCEGDSCKPTLPPGECDLGEECDYIPEVITSCELGIDESSYVWEFENETSGEKLNFTGDYIDNFEFPTQGRWRISVEVTDNCGQSASTEIYVIVTDITVVIDPWDESCVDGEECDEDKKIIPEGECIGPDCEQFPEGGCIGPDCVLVVPEGECDLGEECDYIPEVTTSCELGIDESSYVWEFENETTGEKLNFTGDYIDDFEFPSVGRWKVSVEVTDNCGQSASTEIYVIVTDTPPEENISLSVDILVNPIIGYEALLVDFEGVVFGGTAPYTYSWNFGDAGLGAGKIIDHLYLEKGLYEVLLVVVDKNGLRGDATVLIKVLEDEDRCLEDTDGDGFADCDDLCPTIAGPEENLGCPVYETECDETCGCPDGYSCSDSDPLTCGTGVCLPIEVRSSCLYSPTIGAIFGNTFCSSCPCESSVDFLADIRECDIVFPAITSPDASSIYSRGSVWQVQQ